MKPLVVFLCVGAAVLGAGLPSAVQAQTYEATTVVIDALTTLPVDTGIMASTFDDQFLVVARGAVNVVQLSPLDDGWFDPSGLIRLRRAGQIFGDMPYGCVIGHFDAPPASGFYVGDGGGWSTQSAEFGRTLKLSLNMSPADHAGMSGQFVVSVIRVTSGPSLVIPADPAPKDLGLSGGPNPMDSVTSIEFSCADAGPVHARIYDQSGRWVRTLTNEVFSAGEHKLVWDGRDDSGRALDAGGYFCQVSTASGSHSKRLTLVR